MRNLLIASLVISTISLVGIVYILFSLKNLDGNIFENYYNKTEINSLLSNHEESTLKKAGSFVVDEVGKIDTLDRRTSRIEKILKIWKPKRTPIYAEPTEDYR